MTTDQKIKHLQWYVEQRNISRSTFMQEYYSNVGMGAAGAWFADMTITHDQYNEIKTELNKEITQ